MRTLGESKVLSFVSGVNQRNKREVSPRFLCGSSEVQEFLVSHFASEVACLVCVKCL